MYKYLAKIILLTAVLPIALLTASKPASGEGEYLKFDEPRAVQTMLDEINKLRADADLAPVALDPRLSRVSRDHSLDMIERDFFGHYDPDGRSANDRVRKAGLWYIVSENVGVYRAEGVSLGRIVSDLMGGFNGSPAHRANLLDPAVTHVGIGFYQDIDGRSTIFGKNKPASEDSYGTIFVTQNFYRREITDTTPAELPSEVTVGQNIELSISTVDNFDLLSLHFEKQDFFSEEYYVKATSQDEREFSCNFSFPEDGVWTCKVIGVKDSERGIARGIGQMEFTVE